MAPSQAPRLRAAAVPAGFSLEGQQPHGDGSAAFATGAVCALLAGCAAARALSVGRASSVTMRATGIAINGFGRIGRQVARIAMKDPEVDLKLINASYDAEYLAY